jgi:2-polyprenyl-3-methyl-5-hydroxy-6-metoxy-1,4-benzoquinol methylase
MDTTNYYPDLVAAFVRGHLGPLPDLSTEEIVERGKAAGLRLHTFKRHTELPRVRRVLGILHGLAPETLVDIGSGRGTFLWPLLDAFPYLQVTAVDVDPIRVQNIEAVRKGGIDRLSAQLMDAEELGLRDKSADVVTVLEVLEHVQCPERVAAEAVRVARGFVIVSVPSHPDANPEHIRLFTTQGLDALLQAAGARSISIDHVPNHIIAVARV